MSENWQIALFTLLGGALATVICAGTSMFYLLAQRISRIETIIEVVGSKAFKSLHHADDRFQLDALVDKYTKNNYDLHSNDWLLVYNICSARLEKGDITDPESRASLMLSLGLAAHKLMRAGISVKMLKEDLKTTAPLEPLKKL